jgi:hypothetical protein
MSYELVSRMSWYPESDETLVHRGRVSFATGRAEKVAGMRWFRDETGRDLGAELPGWPEGPVYTPRSDATARTNKAVWGIGKAVVVVAAMAINAVSNANPDVDLGDGARPTDPAREAEDFPVLVAAAGTLARTLPYQLDPDRRGKLYTTELAVTDRRLVVLWTNVGAGVAPVLLWEAPRDVLDTVVKHAFGSTGSDVSFVFTDGSRARLALESPAVAIQLTHELCPAARVEMSELALKKLKSRAEPTKLEHIWEAVTQDDGEVLAQRVLFVKGKQLRTRHYHITEWVGEQPGDPDDSSD